jgi:hypothetical protein
LKRTFIILILAVGFSWSVHGESVIVPGEVNSLCYYDNFFYNLPESDFLFYFNEALMYTEPPDDTVYDKAMRDKYLKLVRQHRLIREFIAGHGNGQNLSISLNLKNDQGLDQAVKFLALLGLGLKKDSSAALAIKPFDEENQAKYYIFCRLNVSALQTQLNQTGLFFFKLQETSVPLPWDFGFLSASCGLPINSETFFEQMLANKRFSFLLSMLFRLSDKEVDFLSQALPKASASAWKRIITDKKLQMGMLVLSNALRVQDGHLFFPGGDKAKKLWSALVGIDPDRAPFDFLTQLSTMDQGKLNYLFVLSFFLPEENRRILFFDYDETKVRRLYQKISLAANERIKANSFPRLEYFTYYSLLHILRIQEGRIHLPLGIHAWAQAMGLPLPPGADECDFLESLLAASAGSGKKMSLLQRFMSIYSKFNSRQLLLSQEFLNKAFAEFESKNILLDFAEKIPLKENESIEALFSWQDGLLKLNAKDRSLYTALGQSLLEIIAQAARFSPDQGDFDKVIRELLEIPWQRPVFYDRLFTFFKDRSGTRSLGEVSNESLFDFILGGLKNREVSIRGEHYEWRARDMFLSQMNEILQSQEVCSFSLLSEINALLAAMAEDPGAFNSRSSRRLLEALAQLPYPDFSKDAPKSIKDRVMAYAKSDLDRDVRVLLKSIAGPAGRDEIKKSIDEIKSNYLLPNLKDYFLALAYALNAKCPKFRIFTNPNLVRLHDFSDNNGSPWNNNSTPGNKAEFSGYCLKGGLSRLNLTFALNWRNQFFEKNIYNPEQTQGMIYNIMDMLPEPMADRSPSFDALLVELAVESLQKCSVDEKLKTAAGAAAMTLTSGYHFRRLNDFLSGRAADYYLFFSELQQIGLYFFENGFMPVDFSKRTLLEKYARMPLSAVIAGESDPWGNIHYNSSGSLLPRVNFVLPQEVAQLFAPGWLPGELLSEYKIKTAYLAYKNDFPSCLLGQFVFDYVSTVGKSIYAQNHVKDYYSTFFLFDIMNSAHLKNTVKKLQKQGYLRLK